MAEVPATTRKARFGPFELDVQTAELRKHGVRVHLQEQPFRILVALLEASGGVVAREQLVDHLWPEGTYVEYERSLNAAVNRLRQALGDSAENPRYVETVARRGYRFVAITSWDPEPAQHVLEIQAVDGEAKRSAAPGANSPAVRSRTPAWRGRGTLLKIAGAIAALALPTWLLIKTGGGPAPEATSSALQRSARPLTAFPGDELDPSLSPDGSQVAFAWNGPRRNNFDIYVKLVGPGEPIQLTNHPAQDTNPVWSPDGRWIAFMRKEEFGPKLNAALYVIPSLGGGERKIGDCRLESPFDSEIAWTPDGNWIAAPCVGSDNVGIRLFSFTSAEVKALTTPGASNGTDSAPAFSYDGRQLAFVRASPEPEIYVQSLRPGYEPAGVPRRITRGSKPAWAPHGQALYFCESRGHLSTPRLAKIPVGAGADGPEILPFGEGADGVAVSQGGRIVFARDRRDTNIVRTGLRATGTPNSEPMTLISSTLDDHTPDFSPDGARVAFASTRSGTEEIWMANADGSHPVQLTFMNGPLTSNPRWSPDGQSILFDSEKAGTGDLWVLDLGTRVARPLTQGAPDELHGRWSRDGKWIYFSRGDNGSFNIWKMPSAGGAPIRVTAQGGLGPYPSPDNNWVYYGKDLRRPTELWRVAVEGGREEFVFDGLSYTYNFAVGQKRIYFVGVDGPVQLLSLGPTARAFVESYEPSTRKRVRLYQLHKPFWFGVALSSDERWFAYSIIEQQDSDLMLVEP